MPSNTYSKGRHGNERRTAQQGQPEAPNLPQPNQHAGPHVQPPQYSAPMPEQGHHWANQTHRGRGGGQGGGNRGRGHAPHQDGQLPPHIHRVHRDPHMQNAAAQQQQVGPYGAIRVGGLPGRGSSQGAGGRGEGTFRGRGRGAASGFGNGAPAGPPTRGGSGGGGRGGGGGAGGGPTIDAERRKYFDGIVKAFVDNGEMHELDFPSTLNPLERHHLHKLAMQYSLDHKSSGPATARVLKLSKVAGTVKVARKANANQLERTVDADGLETVRRVKVIDGYQGLQPLGDQFLRDHASDVVAKTEPLMKEMVSIMSSFLKQSATRRHFTQNHKSVRPAPPPPANARARREELSKFRQGLPAYRQKDALLTMLRHNRVVVVAGDTGCGKTTQIPQLIMDSGLVAPHQHVICTQPRRISALSVAQRVAEERGEACGASVGYVIRFENATSKDTRLMYVTTGILLRRLHTDHDLKDVGVIILDEVHERDVDTDFCLLLLRDLLLKRSHLRIVVMSATIQTERLVAYFERANANAPPPLLSIPGTLFPVQELWLDDVHRWLKMLPEHAAEAKDATSPTGGVASIAIAAGADMTEEFETINKLAMQKVESDAEVVVPFQTLVRVIERYHLENRRNLQGAILVFLPGWGPIERTMTLLRQSQYSREYSILPLHSSLTSAEQQRVFLPAPARFRKIVLATNVAETSITIDDITFVVDSGLQKGTSYEPTANTSALTSQLIAKANGLQRRGRAGRCQAGVCVHLLPRRVYEGLPDFLPPELVRSPLEEVCLQIKAVIPGEKCADVLARALDAPDPSAVPHAVDFLKELGAFDPNEGLTNLGRVLAMLPIHPVLGKMLLFAATIGVLEPVAVIAGALSGKSPFVKPMPHEAKAAREALLELDEGHMSDHLAILRLFQMWKASPQPADFARSHWADHYTLRGISRTKEQLMKLITTSGFLKRVPQPQEYASRHASNTALIRFVLLWSLYPRIGCFELSKRRGRTDMFLWDNKPAQASLSSVGGKARRQQVHQREFCVYFERMKIEAQLCVFDMSALSRTSVALAVHELQTRELATYPEALVDDEESKYGMWDNDCNVRRLAKAARGESVDADEDAPPAADDGRDMGGDTDALSPASPQQSPVELVAAATAGDSTKLFGTDAAELVVLELDFGKKAFVASASEAAALQMLREVLQFYFFYAIQRVDASVFPEQLVEAISIALAYPTASEQRHPTLNGAAAAAAGARGGAASSTAALLGANPGSQPAWTRNHSDDDEEDDELDGGVDDEPTLVIEEELTTDLFDRAMTAASYDSYDPTGSDALADVVAADPNALHKLYEGYGDLAWIRRVQRERKSKEGGAAHAMQETLAPAVAVTAAAEGVKGDGEVVRQQEPDVAPIADDGVVEED